MGGGSLTPFFFCTNLLVRVKLGYTPNFTALGHLEVPWKFLWGGGVVGGWWETPIIIITLHLVKLSWVELRVDQYLMMFYIKLPLLCFKSRSVTSFMSSVHTVLVWYSSHTNWQEVQIVQWGDVGLALEYTTYATLGYEFLIFINYCLSRLLAAQSIDIYSGLFL